jgi:hypothetical protein
MCIDRKFTGMALFAMIPIDDMLFWLFQLLTVRL